MNQFVVPQFIEVEDKIFGPITTRQFLIIMVSAIIVGLAYRFGDFSLFLFCLIFFGGSALVLAFVKVNGQQFHYFLLNMAQSFRRPSKRIWNKTFNKNDLNYWRTQKTEEVVKKQVRKQVKKEKIRDLALLVNTGGFYKPDDY